MIPELAGKKVRAILVERKDKKGALGVMVQGARCVCPLPDGYDMATSVATTDSGYVVVAHPKFAPLVIDQFNGTCKPIEPGHVEAICGRIRLLTH